MSLTSPVRTSETARGKLARTTGPGQFRATVNPRRGPVLGGNLLASRTIGLPARDEGSGDNDGLAAIARYFDLAPAAVPGCFAEDDGNLRIEIETAKLGLTRAEQVRAITLLLVVSRHVGRYDAGPTDAAVVRNECDRHGVLDTNFRLPFSD